MNVADLRSRPATPGDHDRILAVIDEWFGRPVAAKLPRMLLDHFGDTSRVVDSTAGELRAFLVGFLCPAHPDEGYIHFVGVDPRVRGRGVAAELYAEFFELCRAHGRRVVRAMTPPVNTRSVAFHRAMGFEVARPGPGPTSRSGSAA
ncbi:MAG TPA: GNAT family N-acetyltransferase [Jatrophihabitans sp.]|jgi:ribosomal protein S18 acetylase RimI-like enzyme|uniref:GNAT family N-acetyltransferase n=1 Tax=Jatrophihabitans sp. TaxID=1932789 RepID=UPI002E06C64C|nr:GNAT family N-acetyltransferase [Jatrophihabitans sp.]